MPSFLDDYQPVEDRIREFWAEYPEGRIVTEQRDAPAGEYIFVAKIFRDEGYLSTTGWAHESVAQLPANMKASALEVCETSAIGRALANLGFAPKGKRPSREEMHKTSGSDSVGEARSDPDSTEGVPWPRIKPPKASVTPAHVTDQGGEGAGSTGAPAPSPSHDHEWKPSPRASMAAKGWKVCAQPGCGETKREAK